MYEFGKSQSTVAAARGKVCKKFNYEELVAFI